MQTSRKLFLAVMIGLCSTVYGNTSVDGKETHASSEVSLHYGINRVDLDGDGIKDMVVMGRHEYFNAHAFDYVSFLVYMPNADVNWHIVPFPRAKKRFRLLASGGADCTLHDFRLYTPKHSKSKILVVADRKFTKSYGEENTVTFTYYKLSKDPGHEDGPAVYFEQTKVVKTEKKYCDVNRAMAEELGLRYVRSPLLGI